MSKSPVPDKDRIRLQMSGSRRIQMNKWADILKNVSLLTQFGLSLITPLLFCLFISGWLAGQFDLGGWVYIPGFFFGLGGSASVAWKFYVRETSHGSGKQSEQKKKDRVCFNRHS